MSCVEHGYDTDGVRHGPGFTVLQDPDQWHKGNTAIMWRYEIGSPGLLLRKKYIGMLHLHHRHEKRSHSELIGHRSDDSRYAMDKLTECDRIRNEIVALSCTMDQTCNIMFLAWTYSWIASLSSNI